MYFCDSQFQVFFLHKNIWASAGAFETDLTSIRKIELPEVYNVPFRGDICPFIFINVDTTQEAIEHMHTGNSI